MCLYPTGVPCFYHEKKNFPKLWTRRISIISTVRRNLLKQTRFGKGVSDGNIVSILVRLKDVSLVQILVQFTDSNVLQEFCSPLAFR